MLPGHAYWTEEEVLHFLEILKDDEEVKRLYANQPKSDHVIQNVMTLVSKKMFLKGHHRTWQQCRYKLRSLEMTYCQEEKLYDKLDLSDQRIVRNLFLQFSPSQGFGSSVEQFAVLLQFFQHWFKQSPVTHSKISAISNNENIIAKRKSLQALLKTPATKRVKKTDSSASRLMTSPLIKKIFEQSLEKSEEMRQNIIKEIECEVENGSKVSETPENKSKHQYLQSVKCAQYVQQNFQSNKANKLSK